MEQKFEIILLYQHPGNQNKINKKAGRILKKETIIYTKYKNIVKIHGWTKTSLYIAVHLSKNLSVPIVTELNNFG